MENEQNMPEKEPEKAKIDEKTTIIVNSPESTARQVKANALIQKLIDQKSVKKREEELKTEIIDQNLLNELDLKHLLSKDDYLFYQEKKNQYLEFSPDFRDNPFDLDDLHQMIMEQIVQRNLLKRKKLHPAANIEESYAASIKRQNELKKSLSMRRTDRLKNSETKRPTLNIAQLSVSIEDPEKFRQKQVVISQDEEEENQLRNKGDKVIE